MPEKDRLSSTIIARRASRPSGPVLRAHTVLM